MASQSNGGVSQTARAVLFPMVNAATGVVGLWSFNPLSGFNDPNNASIYNYRVEDIIAGRTPTVRRIILTYRDLGVCSPIFMLTGTTDAGKVVSVQTGSGGVPAVTIGNSTATNKLLTKLISLQLTAQNIQCTVIRPANAGPLSYVKLVLVGNIESQEL